MNAENTRATPSALPAASKTELGCHSSDKTVVRSGFLMCLATHQSLSSSNWHTAIVRAPLATANFSSLGDHLTNVADLFNRKSTSVGSQAGYLNEKGELPDAQKPLLVDSLAAIAGGAASSSSATTYIESASGVASSVDEIAASVPLARHASRSSSNTQPCQGWMSRRLPNDR